LLKHAHAGDRLALVEGAGYNFADNGRLLTTGSQTDTWNVAEIAGSSQPLAVSYDGPGNRVAQMTDAPRA